MKKIFLTGSTGFFGSKFLEMYGSKYDILSVSRHDQKNPLDLLDFSKTRKALQQFQPDVIVHTAMPFGRDSSVSDDIMETTSSIMKTLVDAANQRKIPFIFTSTEAVYSGRTDGGYLESDVPQPRNQNGEAKVMCEAILRESGLPYLITRGHRFIGWSKNFNSPKQFVDAVKALLCGQTIHCDSRKLFTPMLINHLAYTIDYYIDNLSDQQLTLNVGVSHDATYYELMSTVAQIIGVNYSLVKPDGEEEKWLDKNTFNLDKAKLLGFPTVSWQEMIKVLESDLPKLN
jgi:dTDP-4-dehydrorhamnose reductase